MFELIWISLVCIVFINGLQTCDKSSPFFNPFDKSCTIVVSPPANGLIESRVVVTNEIEGKTTIKCLGSNCKNNLNVWAGNRGSFDLYCQIQDACIGAKVRIGEPDEIPRGFNREQFMVPTRKNTDHVDMDCLAVGSCIGSVISVTGDYPGGVKVTAMGKDSFDSAQLICNIKPGQSCKLICDESTSCDTSDLICISGDCQCIGNSCKQMIFPIGSDPVVAKVLGFSPNKAGLECIAGTDDNPPDECRFAPIKYASNGIIVCSENYDCCMCQELKCDDCKSVMCNGDQGCIGNHITVDGDPKGGAQINCNGDKSCQYAKIVAEAITALNINGDLACQGCDMKLNSKTKADSNLPALHIPCGGDGSCYGSKIIAKYVQQLGCGGDTACMNSEMDIECKTLGKDKGCLVSCGGDKGCYSSSWNVIGCAGFSANGDHGISLSNMNMTLVKAGAPFRCSGPHSCEKGTFNLINVAAFECGGRRACFESIFNILCSLPKGCMVGCSGIDACNDISLYIENVVSLTCGSVSSCKYGNINMNCLSPSEDKGCAVSCGAAGACHGLNLRANNVGSVSCIGSTACKMSHLRLACSQGKKGCTMMCGGINACTEADMEVDNVGELMCQGKDVCLRSKMKLLGSENGCAVTCSGGSTCNNSTMIVDNAISLSCSGIKSCKFSELTLKCIDKAPQGCKQITCGSKDACSHAVFDVINSGGIGCTRDACSYSTFKFANNKGGFLSCIGVESCYQSLFDRLDNIMEYTCNGRKACAYSTIYGGCKSGGCNFACNGFRSCKATYLDITGLKMLKCDNNEACDNANMTLRTDLESFEGNCATKSCGNTNIVIKSFNKIKTILGFKCASPMACTGSYITFDGTDLGNTDKLLIKNIQCAGAYSCVGTTFIFKNAYIERSTLQKACSGIKPCDTSTINMICQDNLGNIISDNSVCIK